MSTSGIEAILSIMLYVLKQQQKTSKKNT